MERLGQNIAGIGNTGELMQCYSTSLRRMLERMEDNVNFVGFLGRVVSVSVLVII